MKDFIKNLRRKTGLSQADFAKAIGLSAGSGDRLIRRWEAGDVEPSGPALRCMQNLNLAFPCDDQADSLLPKFVVGYDSERQNRTELLYHMRWPRFIAVILDECIATKTSKYIAPIDGGIEYLAIIAWLDSPRFHDIDALLKEAATAFSIYNMTANDDLLD